MHPYPRYHRLMLITHRGSSPVEQYLRFLRICLEAGVTSVQLREKNSSFSFQVELGQKMHSLCQKFSVPLIINDDPRLAYALNAEGVHLGQEDGDPAAAFKLLGKDKIIGLSIEKIEEIEISNTLPFISYVTASAVFPTDSKYKEGQTFWGLSGVEELARRSTHTLTAIGGIDLENAPQVMNAGAQGLALIGALHNAEDPAQAVRAFRSITG